MTINKDARVRNREKNTTCYNSHVVSLIINSFEIFSSHKLGWVAKCVIWTSEFEKIFQVRKTFRLF